MKKIIPVLILLLVFSSFNKDSTQQMNNKTKSLESISIVINDREAKSNNKTKHFDCNYVSEFTVENLNNLNAYEDEIVEHFTKNPLLENVRNIREIMYSQNNLNNKEYIEAMGDNDDGGLTSIRAEVVTKNISKSNYLLKVGMTFDICKGLNCSKCSFNDDKGCKCSEPDNEEEENSYCNHSTSC